MIIYDTERNICPCYKQCGSHLLLEPLDNRLSFLENLPLARALGLIRKVVTIFMECYLLECDQQISTSLRSAHNWSTKR